MAFNSVFKERHKKIHLVGIGGIGMSGIARVLLESGFAVTGSDIADSKDIQGLVSLGAQIFIGHHESHVGDADVVVFSSAVAPDNPEILQGRRNAKPIIPRAVMLAELMRLRCGIAICGAHGKTTTTSLIGMLMHRLGLDPTVVIGGVVNHFGANAVVGKGQFMVTEADESDGTFLHLSPTIAVVTNIDAEHLDYYQGGIEEIIQKFQDFLSLLPFYGLAVVCSDDPHLSALLPQINRRVVTYGFNDEAHIRAINIVTKDFSTSFDLLVRNQFIGTFIINLVGHYNVLNCLAAIAVLDELGVKPEALLEPLHEFSGVKRRFTRVSFSEHFSVIDDYAHHPTEIKAVLQAARNSFKDKKIHVLFQPHRFSRTRDLLEEFSHSFADCDSLIVTEIYGAAEEPIPGINAHTLIEKINNAGVLQAGYATDIFEGAELMAALVQKNDVVLTLGAGSITKAAPKLAELLTLKYGDR